MSQRTRPAKRTQPVPARTRSRREQSSRTDQLSTNEQRDTISRRQQAVSAADASQNQSPLLAQEEPQRKRARVAAELRARSVPLLRGISADDIFGQDIAVELCLSILCCLSSSSTLHQRAQALHKISGYLHDHSQIRILSDGSHTVPLLAPLSLLTPAPYAAMMAPPHDTDPSPAPLPFLSVPQPPRSLLTPSSVALLRHSTLSAASSLAALARTLTAARDAKAHTHELFSDASSAELAAEGEEKMTAEEDAFALPATRPGDVLLPPPPLPQLAPPSLAELWASTGLVVQVVGLGRYYMPRAVRHALRDHTIVTPSALRQAWCACVRTRDEADGVEKAATGATHTAYGSAAEATQLEALCARVLDTRSYDYTVVGDASRRFLYAYDVWLSDGTHVSKAVLHPALGHAVQLGALQVGAVVRVLRMTQTAVEDTRVETYVGVLEELAIEHTCAPLLLSPAAVVAPDDVLPTLPAATVRAETEAPRPVDWLNAAEFVKEEDVHAEASPPPAVEATLQPTQSSTDAGQLRNASALALPLGALPHGTVGVFAPTTALPAAVAVAGGSSPVSGLALIPGAVVSAAGLALDDRGLQLLPLRYDRAHARASPVGAVGGPRSHAPPQCLLKWHSQPHALERATRPLTGPLDVYLPLFGEDPVCFHGVEVPLGSPLDWGLAHAAATHIQERARETALLELDDGVRASEVSTIIDLDPHADTDSTPPQPTLAGAVAGVVGSVNGWNDGSTATLPSHLLLGAQTLQAPTLDALMAPDVPADTVAGSGTADAASQGTSSALVLAPAQAAALVPTLAADPLLLPLALAQAYADAAYTPDLGAVTPLCELLERGAEQGLVWVGRVVAKSRLMSFSETRAGGITRGAAPAAGDISAGPSGVLGMGVFGDAVPPEVAHDATGTADDYQRPGVALGPETVSLQRGRAVHRCPYYFECILADRSATVKVVFWNRTAVTLWRRLRVGDVLSLRGVRIQTVAVTTIDTPVATTLPGSAPEANSRMVSALTRERPVRKRRGDTSAFGRQVQRETLREVVVENDAAVHILPLDLTFQGRVPRALLPRPIGTAGPLHTRVLPLLRRTMAGLAPGVGYLRPPFASLTALAALPAGEHVNVCGVVAWASRVELKPVLVRQRGGLATQRLQLSRTLLLALVESSNAYLSHPDPQQSPLFGLSERVCVPVTLFSNGDAPLLCSVAAGQPLVLLDALVQQYVQPERPPPRADGSDIFDNDVFVALTGTTVPPPPRAALPVRSLYLRGDQFTQLIAPATLPAHPHVASLQPVRAACALAAALAPSEAHYWRGEPATAPRLAGDGDVGIAPSSSSSSSRSSTSSSSASSSSALRSAQAHPPLHAHVYTYLQHALPATTLTPPSLVAPLPTVLPSAALPLTSAVFLAPRATVPVPTQASVLATPLASTLLSLPHWHALHSRTGVDIAPPRPLAESLSTARSLALLQNIHAYSRVHMRKLVSTVRGLLPWRPDTGYTLAMDVPADAAGSPLYVPHYIPTLTPASPLYAFTAYVAADYAQTIKTSLKELAPGFSADLPLPPHLPITDDPRAPPAVGYLLVTPPAQALAANAATGADLTSDASAPSSRAQSQTPVSVALSPLDTACFNGTHADSNTLLSKLSDWLRAAHQQNAARANTIAQHGTAAAAAGGEAPITVTADVGEGAAGAMANEHAPATDEQLQASIPTFLACFCAHAPPAVLSPSALLFALLEGAAAKDFYLRAREERGRLVRECAMVHMSRASEAWAWRVRDQVEAQVADRERQWRTGEVVVSLGDGAAQLPSSSPHTLPLAEDSAEYLQLLESNRELCAPVPALLPLCPSLSRWGIDVLALLEPSLAASCVPSSLAATTDAMLACALPHMLVPEHTPGACAGEAAPYVAATPLTLSPVCLFSRANDALVGDIAFGMGVLAAINALLVSADPVLLHHCCYRHDSPLCGMTPIDAPVDAARKQQEQAIPALSETGFAGDALDAAAAEAFASQKQPAAEFNALWRQVMAPRPTASLPGVAISLRNIFVDPTAAAVRAHQRAAAILALEGEAGREPSHAEAQLQYGAVGMSPAAVHRAHARKVQLQGEYEYADADTAVSAAEQG